MAQSDTQSLDSVEQEDMGSTSSRSSSTSADDSDNKISFPPDIEKDVPGQCTFCRKILWVAELPFDRVTTHISLPIGNLVEMLAADCPDHQGLLETFRNELKLDTAGAASELTIFRDYWSSSFSFSHKPHSDNTDFLDDGHTQSLDVLGGTEGLAIAPDVASINPEVCTEWYRDCINQHGDNCARPEYLEYLPLARPEYLIDVVNNCLVPVHATAPVPPYAALSYVWGKVPMLSAALSNLADLQKPGSLQAEANKLPRTVRHAMYVTANLLPDIRYVWVDAICIEQDNAEMLHRHLPQMGSIYAHAALVIAAISGDDAEHGLRGLSDAPMPVPRHLSPVTTVKLRNMTFIQRRQERHRDYEDSKQQLRYFTRGWTFQEHFFARRSLLFDSQRGISFHCCVSAMTEDHKKPDFASKTMSRGRDFIMNVGYPSLTVLSNIIEDFNRRELSFPQDCQLAFAGVVPCYRHIFTGGFLAGMPSMFIDAVLLWQPLGKLTRRVATVSRNQQSGALPSWSWVGWQGALDFEGWYAGNDFIASCSGFIASPKHEIVSTTDWSICDAPDSARRKVRCLWTEWKEKHRDESVELPDGWTKRPKRRGERFTCPDAPRGYGKYVYQYQGSENPTFWYPIPLGQNAPVRDDTIGKDIGSDAYLCGQVSTITAHVIGAVRHVDKWSFEGNTTIPCVCLGNDQDEWVGMLRLATEDYLQERGIGHGSEVQLIAISEGSIANGKKWSNGFIDEYDMKERPQGGEGELYEFVNVLWITWGEVNSHRVAQREALGRVAKVHWEAFRPSVVDVILG